MEFSKEIIGEKLKKIRIERGINAIEIANALDITKSAISQIESGTVYPSIETLVKLCRFLEISADWLLGLTD